MPPRNKRTPGKNTNRRHGWMHPPRHLFKTMDHGDAIHVTPGAIDAHGEQWMEPFLTANRSLLNRLELRPEVRLDPMPRLLLHPGSRVGALPLLSPSTRKVAAGLLVEPRFTWAGLGSVFGAIGFSVEPVLGGAPLVPGSAREVPPWLLAAPVIQRIAAFLKHRHRGFTPREEYRTSPRGRIEWGRWATHDIPRGRWTRLPCCFTDPDDDPNLMAAIRWTLLRVKDELSAVAWSPPARALLQRTSELLARIGAGAVRRPVPGWLPLGKSEWLTSAMQAMGWIAEERGLGGSRVLDGLSWDLSIAAVWEAWVAAFAQEVANQLGLVASSFAGIRHGLHWSGGVQSMGSLAPDVELCGGNQRIWIDAKYKPHFALLSRGGWQGMSEDVRHEHRADLHQALAYSAIGDSDRISTVLVYPLLGDRAEPTFSHTTMSAGRRSIRLVLAALPFGFNSIAQANTFTKSWSEYFTVSLN